MRNGGEMAYFTVIWEHEKEGHSGYSGRCLEISGITSKGETLGELKASMIDAITHALQDMKTCHLLSMTT
jgi:predicted RNase H-like HicB family nuclease